LRLRARRAGAGFTLIEILVVVVIIAVMIAGFVLSVGAAGADRDLTREGERLAALIGYVREQAELQTREFGLEIAPDRYAFLVFDARRGIWDTPADETLRERALPAGVAPELVLDGRPALLRARKADEARLPQVMLFSNGDVSPFELQLRREGEPGALRLAAQPDGSIELREPSEVSR
jgi:general secretion pathway protein H